MVVDGRAGVRVEAQAELDEAGIERLGVAARQCRKGSDVRRERVAEVGHAPSSKVVRESAGAPLPASSSAHRRARIGLPRLIRFTAGSPRNPS